MSLDLFIPIKFNTMVQLLPKEICVNIEDVIFAKVKKNLENMCSKHGYIKHDSIKIIKRSIGQIRKAHFNGNIIYNLQCIAEICNPAHGSIVKCRVKAKNSMGLLAEGFYENIPILEIIIPKISAGIHSEINIDSVKIGDEINIEVCGKKFMLFDKHISIIGKAIKDKEESIIIDSILNELTGGEGGEEDDVIPDPDLDGIIIDDDEADEEDNEDEEEEDEENEEDEDQENEEEISIGGDLDDIDDIEDLGDGDLDDYIGDD